MFPVIDFRNGRYQGQTKNQLPHGLGCFMDRNFLFCIGEWISGELQGNTIIIFPSGTVFYGRLNFRKMQGICFFQLASDHVKLITNRQTQNRQRQIEKIAAIMPLFQIVLDIDNSNAQAKVLQEYDYSNKNEEENMKIVSKILNLDRNDSKKLQYCKNFLQYFETTFFSSQHSIFQFLISGSKGKKQYFCGLKGQGLGVKVQPTDELTSKKVENIYKIRGMGYFTKENQLKDIGRKTIDNSMKGVIYQEGVYSLPNTIIKYQKGKRPVNCSINMHSYLKRSLFYRDKVLNTEYIYDLQQFAFGFNENLRKIQTQRLAQTTIQNPKPQIEKTIDDQVQRRNEYLTRKYDRESSPSNPYRLNANRTVNPQYNLNAAKEDIYYSANKKGYIEPSVYMNYKKPEYVDPMYQKIDRDYDFVPVRERNSPNKYEPRQYSPKKNNYLDPDERYYPSYQPRPQRVSPTRNNYNYPQKNYPNSLYPQRSESPRRVSKYTPSYYNYQQDEYGYPYYDRRR